MNIGIERERVAGTVGLQENKFSPYKYVKKWVEEILLYHHSICAETKNIADLLRLLSVEGDVCVTHFSQTKWSTNILNRCGRIWTRQAESSFLRFWLILAELWE